MAAEFRIARFKHTWKGAWTAGTVYNPDDIIRISGKVYNCLVRHTADTNFYTDLLYLNNDIPPVAEPKWELVADGYNFRNEWTTSTEYFIGDIVKIGGSIYICIERHESAATAAEFENDLNVENYWAVFNVGNNWAEDWTTGTQYQVGDVISYSGLVYKCNDAHTSSSLNNPGLLEDLSKWDIILKGSKWRNAWIAGSIYYVNDVVRYGGNVYRCIVQHAAGNDQNGLEINSANWELVHVGIEYKGPWTDNFRYKVNDVVKHGSYVYICITHHNVNPAETFNYNYWTIFCPGNEFKATWSSATLYKPGDVVRQGGYIYVAVQENINVEPNYDQTNTTSAWNLLFAGTRVRTNAWSASNTYKAGDIVRRNGQVYVAIRNVTTGVDVDIIGDGSSINTDDWELVIPGVNWRAFWFEGSTYLIGDLVQYKGASYRCIVKHDASLVNRPDLDGGVNWEQYTYGDPNNVLAIIGDIKRYGASGTEEISIGTDGQTLKVVDGLPEWNDFNSSADVYYVSLEGVDAEGRGTTLNSSWRTVRYALDNITGPATVIVKAGTFDEVLPLRIPAFVAVVGDELRSTVIRPAENYFTSTDIDHYEYIIDFVNTFIGNVVRKITITNKFGDLPQIITGTGATEAEASTVEQKFTLIKTQMTTGVSNTFISTNTLTVDANVLNAVSQLNNNKAFIFSEVQAWLSENYPGYAYDTNELRSSIYRMIKAIVYDLRYTGNFQTLTAANFFYNASNYSSNKMSNMFLFGNATGARNMTWVGLSGSLGSLNANLTRRPTAGAYASLDPGWGTSDSTVWITGRSPYIQNVTTFGEGCVGFKIDGDLHNGGFKTMVSNDFTQILSDGIGVWCNGEGASECVSVFTYYNHIGYLCTNGGKIRGTNGNCSYGTYGAVAEGFNLNETPITAVVNNRFYDATVGQIFTSGGSIIKLMYDHAGQDYTNVSYTLAGSGISANLLFNEFRDKAVNEVRIANVNDSSIPSGGGFTININNAQAGDAYSVTLAASTDETPATYRGLRLIVNTGTGAGQYGYIADYDNGTKVALIGNEFYTPWTTTSSNGTTDKFTLNVSASANGLFVNDRICFTGTAFGGVANNTIYYVKTIDSNEITISDTLGGSTFDLSSATGSMTVHKLGWIHLQPGTPILSGLDTTSSYFIEPRPTFSTPTTSVSTYGMTFSHTWTSVAFGAGKFVAVHDGINAGTTSAAYSIDGGENWVASVIPLGRWTKVRYGGGYFVAVSLDGKVARSSDGINWSAGTIPNAEYTSLAYSDTSDVWVAVARGGRNTARSTDDGLTWSAVLMPEGADWSDVAFGKGTFVAVSESDSAVVNTAYSTDNGVSWTLGSLSGGCKSIAFGNNRFVAIAGGYSGANDAYVSFDGIAWGTYNIQTANYQAITYGQGLFLAVARADNLAATSVDGVHWFNFDITLAGEARDIAFGNYNETPGFIIVYRGTYDVLKVSPGLRAQGRIYLTSNRVSAIRVWEPGHGYTSVPTLTIFDPNNSTEASAIVRTENGVLATPTILNGGAGWVTTSTRITLSGDGFTDKYQVGNELIVDNATRIPGPGDNLRIASVDDYVYKLLTAEVISGTVGNYRLRLTVAKDIGSNESPEHGTGVLIRQKYSQVRLTGHDFLDIGLGNFTQTNYPDTLFPVGTILAPEDEIDEFDGGRVFYTSTDQDGNFRVGELFAVEQATGTVTISAEFFELQGLEEISLGGVTVGGSGVVIREFSTDPLFVADSNNIIPTQAAIKSYISRRISGGGSDAFTTTFTAGIIRIGPNLITTTTLDPITIDVPVKITGLVQGTLLAQALFLGGEGFTL